MKRSISLILALLLCLSLLPGAALAQESEPLPPAALTAQADTAAAEEAADEIPADETPANETPADEIPAEEEVPAEEVPLAVTPPANDGEGEEEPESWYDESQTAFTLTTAEELLELAELVTAGTTFNGKTVTLGNDINLAGKPWPGIGVYSETDPSKAFQGIFDGAGHKITNVTFANTSANSYRGFFNLLYNATVENLTVSCAGFASGITGSYGGAAIAGFAWNSTIEDCVSEGELSGTHNVAGIVVRIKDSNVLRCTNKAELSNDYTKIGGIVALSQNSYTGCVIDGCTNEGRITSTTERFTSETVHGGIGGIIGWVGYASSGGGNAVTAIKNCTNTASIDAPKNEFTPVGQIAGQIWIEDKNTTNNKGIAGMLAVDHLHGTKGMNFGLVTGGVVTYTDSLEAGNTYLVTANNAAPSITLAAKESVSFDCSLANILNTDSIKAGALLSAASGNKVTYTAATVKIGSTGYATLSEALTAAEANATVTLLGDVTEDVTIDKSLTLELGEYALDSAITADETVKLTISGTNSASLITLPALEDKTGYNFGWAAGETKATKLATGRFQIMPEEDAKTYASEWTLAQFTIRFDSDGGSEVAPITQDYNSGVTAPEAPTKTGYRFDGWLDADGEKVEIPTVMPAEDMTFKAAWKANAYRIYFEGGEGATGSVESVLATYDVEQKLPKNSFTFADKIFAGWALESDKTTVVYADEEQVKNLVAKHGGSVTLYAVWTDKAVVAPDTETQTYTYDGEEQAFEVEDGYTVRYLQNGEKVAKPVNAGSYDVILSRPEDDTYAAYVRTLTNALVIEKVRLTVTYAGESILVGETPALALSVTGFVGDETAATAAGYIAPTLTTDKTAAGDYLLTPSGGEAANYSFVYVSGTLRIIGANLGKNGWQQSDGLWCYVRNGKLVTGWLKTGGLWYYMADDGIMQTGWLGSGSKRFYLTSDGSMSVGWEKIYSRWYYFDENGYMQTGWVEVDGEWYYLSSSGIMQTGWLWSGGKSYYLASDGAMSVGWTKVNGIWFYFNENGHMQTGWVEVDGEWYYMNSSGYMQTGWLSSGGKWYFLERSGANMGRMVRDTSLRIDGQNCKFDANGVWIS